MNQEIERKFLISKIPENVDKTKREAIRQGYLCAEESREVRVRAKGDKFFLAYKNGSGIVRTEIEFEITKEQFDLFWAETEGRRLEKERFYYPYKDWTVEVDHYFGNLAGLIVAEVEFSSEEEANDFTPPAEFGKDISLETAFKNRYLIKHGLPEGFQLKYGSSS